MQHSGPLRRLMRVMTRGMARYLIGRTALVAAAVALILAALPLLLEAAHP